MTKLTKNRFVLALLSLVLAVVLLLGYSSLVQQESKKTPVVRVTAEIARGEPITAEKLTLVEVGGYNLESSAIHKLEDVVGKYAATGLIPGQTLLAGMVTEEITGAADRLATLDGSRYAYSITIKDFANGVSDKLMSGDIVSLFVYDTEAKEVLQPPELSYVEVLATTTGNGLDKESETVGEDADNLKTATLLVTPGQAKALTAYEDSAEIHLALVYRGDAETARKFLEKQEEALEDA